jgi:CRISP-associated protein Cas1
MDQILPQLKPIPMKERLSILFINYGRLDVIDGLSVVSGKTGFG